MTPHLCPHMFCVVLLVEKVGVFFGCGRGFEERALELSTTFFAGKGAG